MRRRALRLVAAKPFESAPMKMEGQAGPVVTVGIPVWNGADYLPAALASVRAQAHLSLEIIIADNGSTDDTENICRAAVRADSRIRYLRSERNRGGTWNYNRLLQHARGDFFMWVAADDVILPTFISRCLDVFAASGEDVVLVCPRGRFIDSAGEVTEDRDDADLAVDASHAHTRVSRLLRAQASHLMYGLIRRSALRATDGLRPMVGDDMVLLTELACLGRFGVVPDQLLLQRRHVEQSSAQGKDEVKWHAPTGRASFAFPQIRLNLTLGWVVAIGPLPVAERTKCLVAVLRDWVLPRWRGMGRDLKTAIGISG